MKILGLLLPCGGGALPYGSFAYALAPGLCFAVLILRVRI
ncbi:MAG: hypothetical protein QOH35_5880 [Acidobacteriaceae bacterium]|jgi:hypothetical protein|nr:hypothetical protein [Acidobacteriaceae bacterium]